MADQNGAWTKSGKFTTNPSRVAAIKAGRKVQAAKKAAQKIMKKLAKSK